MTKPADSDQIAKARAEKFLDKWKLPPLDPVLLKMAGHTTAFAIHFAVAFAASERQAVIEDHRRKLCVYCNNANSWNPATNGKHAYKFGPDERFCDARSLCSLEPKGGVNE